MSINDLSQNKCYELINLAMLAKDSDELSKEKPLSVTVMGDANMPPGLQSFPLGHFSQLVPRNDVLFITVMFDNAVVLCTHEGGVEWGNFIREVPCAQMNEPMTGGRRKNSKHSRKSRKNRKNSRKNSRKVSKNRY
jgi:hypothetical protein